MTEPTSTLTFAYDSYVVDVTNTPTDLTADTIKAFAPKFASAYVKGNTTGLKADEAGEVAEVEMYYVTIDSGSSPKYALVGFLHVGTKLRFGVVGFDANKKVNDIKFYLVNGNDENKVVFDDDFIGIKSGETVLFGVVTDTSATTSTIKFMLPPKSFFLDGIHVNPFEPFPATSKTGLPCVRSGIIALAENA